MGSGTIETDRGKIYLSEISHAIENKVWICLVDDPNNSESEGFINKQQAGQIIAHLQEQFNLKQATT